MDHHNGRTGGIARPDVDDVERRAGDLDHPASRGIATSVRWVCGGGRVTVLQIERAKTEKKFFFGGDKRVVFWARGARFSPPYRSCLHIAVIGNFIFIAIRTAASWRARSIQAVF